MTGFSVVDRESGLVLGTRLSLEAACRLRDALTTQGDPVVVSGQLREGENLKR